MDIGKAIKQARQQRGLKQNAFAEMCQITPSYLSQIEKNQKDINLSKLKAIAEALEMPLQILFFLSMTDEDIQPNKREAYKIIEPSIKALINQFFITN